MGESWDEGKHWFIIIRIHRKWDSSWACFCGVEEIGWDSSKQVFVTLGFIDVPGYGQGLICHCRVAEGISDPVHSCQPTEPSVFAAEVELCGCCAHLEDVSIISAQAACLVGRETLGPSQGFSSASLDGITWGNPKPDLASGATGEEISQWVFTSWFPVADFQPIFFLLKIFTAIKWQTKPISKGKQLGWWMCPAKEGCKHAPQAARRNEPFLQLRDTNPAARFHPACSPSNKPPQ